MTVLEDLWYGDIRPVEQFVEGNTEYKNLLHLMAKNRENLAVTLSPEQSKLFEKYCTVANETTTISEMAAFKYGFNLAIGLLVEFKM